MFKRAERKKAKLRLALCSPSGGGKTYSSLLVAKGLGGPIAMIDTERGSGELYADLVEYDVAQVEPPFSPGKYVQAIQAAEKAGYSVIIIDSLTHAWAGQGGLLEEVDKRKSSQKNQFAAWREVTPQHNALVDAMLQSSCHIIATMRTKTAYDMQRDSQGNLKPVKVGLAPVQRDGMEYEFTVVLDLDIDKHMATASKDRTRLFDGKYFVPTVETGQQLKAWLESGKEPEQPEKQQPATQQSSQQQAQTQHEDQNQTRPQEQAEEPATLPQQKKLNILLEEFMGKDRTVKIQSVNEWLTGKGSKKQISTSKELTKRECSELIETLQNDLDEAKNQQTRQPMAEMDDLPF